VAAGRILALIAASPLLGNSAVPASVKVSLGSAWP
jgi:flagellar biosynthesis protein FliR